MASTRQSESFKEDYRRMRGLMATMIFLQDHPKREALLRVFCDKSLPKMQTRAGRVFIQHYLDSLPPQP